MSSQLFDKANIKRVLLAFQIPDQSQKSEISLGLDWNSNLTGVFFHKQTITSTRVAAEFEK